MAGGEDYTQLDCIGAENHRFAEGCDDTASDTAPSGVHEILKLGMPVESRSITASNQYHDHLGSDSRRGHLDDRFGMDLRLDYFGIVVAQK